MQLQYKNKIIQYYDDYYKQKGLKRNKDKLSVNNFANRPIQIGLLLLI